MKIITIIGARPQFIKASVLSNLIKNRDDIKEVIIHTGQHFDEMMSDIFFKELNIPSPDYELGISSLSHGAMTGRMIEKIEVILLDEKPDLVIVYGDTNSTLASAISASKLNIPIAHIEAGLRSFNNEMPEEINRKLTDHVSSYLFCPTEISVNNLKNENITKNVHLVGDIMYDLFLQYENNKTNILEKLNIKEKEYCLLTIHRQENTNNKTINELLLLFNRISISHNIKFVFPVHPRTFKYIDLGIINSDYIKIINPVSYIDMINLEKNSKIIFTDSGGVQKEAYFSNTPCITLRKETEWIELLDTKMNVLTGIDSEKIYENFIKFLINDNYDFSKKLYGDGKCGQKILKKI